MKKIAIVTTGGTIGSERHGSIIEIDAGSNRLNSLINTITSESNVAADLVPAINKLSENFEPSDWVTVNDVIKSVIDQGVTRIVVTHGTDTPHFTGTYLSLFKANNAAKICITGAYYSPDHENSDAARNIKSAISYVVSDHTPTGVYAAFATDDIGNALIARATELAPLRYDERNFRSIFRDCAPNFDGEKVTLADEVAPFDADIKPEQVKQMQQAQGMIGYALSYPGDNAFVWRALPENGVLIVESYHGGTATNSETVRALAWLRDARPDLAICLTSIPSKFIPTPYETSTDLSSKGIWVLKDVPSHVVYVTALSRLAAGYRGQDALAPFAHLKI